MLVERENSLQVLITASSRANLGHGSTVILAGEAGIGKTSLLHEFVRKANANQKVFWGGCEALFTARALGPLQDMAHAIAPSLGELLDRGADQNRIFPAMLGALQNMRHCSVLIFEDVHWADNATLDLIKYLGRRIAMLKTVLILSLRSDEVGNVHPLSQVIGDLPVHSTTRIELQPLSPDAVLAMAREAGHSGNDLHKITAGNPFFVTELLAGAENQNGNVPASVRDAVWSRISRLANYDRQLLEVVSISPGYIERWLVMSIMGADAEHGIQRCIEQGVLQNDENGNIQFRHELARLAILTTIGTELQIQRHIQMNAAMSVAIAGGATIAASKRVHHAAGAHDGAQVLALVPQAAADAARLGAHQQSASLLQTALRYSDGAPKSLVAQLNEDWAHEAGVSIGGSDEIIAARLRAMALWRELDRPEKVAHNLRRISGQYRYQGDSRRWIEYLDQAIQILEKLPPGLELALTFSARATFHSMHDQLDETIFWGTKTIELAEELGEVEPRIQALNSVGLEMMVFGRAGGEEKLKESIALSLQHGFHSQAARGYENYADALFWWKKFELTEKILLEGIAFASAHDLDFRAETLVIMLAALRLAQGRFREAKLVVEGILANDRSTLTTKLPANYVLALSNIRLGNAGGMELMEKTLQTALAVGEKQYISPAQFAMVEVSWLSGNLDSNNVSLNDLFQSGGKDFDQWDLGELATWLQRYNIKIPFAISPALIPSPYWAELKGELRNSSDEWMELGLPYKAALVLLQSKGESAGEDIAKAVTILETLEAAPAIALARQIAKHLGIAEQLPKARRGPYAAARKHPLRLTARELQVLNLILQGLGNLEISRRIVRSQRTVEHHVSSILGKLNATNRMEVLLRLGTEPWLLPSEYRVPISKNK